MSEINFNTEIENAVVSIQLDGEEQTTVPSGEEWKVTLSMGKESTDGDWFSYVRINGRNAMSIAGTDGEDWQSHGSSSFSTILVDGDTIRCDTESIGNNDVGCAITGFKIGQ